LTSAQRTAVRSYKVLRSASVYATCVDIIQRDRQRVSSAFFLPSRVLASLARLSLQRRAIRRLQHRCFPLIGAGSSSLMGSCRSGRGIGLGAPKRRVRESRADQRSAALQADDTRVARIGLLIVDAVAVIHVMCMLFAACPVLRSPWALSLSLCGCRCVGSWSDEPLSASMRPCAERSSKATVQMGLASFLMVHWWPLMAPVHVR